MHYSTTQLRNHDYEAHQLKRKHGSVCLDCSDVHSRYYVCEPMIERYSTTEGVAA